MRVYPIFAWYDFWVGFYWDRTKKRLYFLPVPMLGIVFDFGSDAFVRQKDADPLNKVFEELD